MDPVVVLGAKVVEGEHSILVSRLQKALSLYDELLSRPFVVSGRGEAPYMAEWLIARGVPPELIVLEENATSTNENLENSRALFPDASRLIVVTNNFHVLRTKVWAWHLGIPVDVVGAPTPRRKRLKNYVREVGAVPHSATRVLWRRFRARSFFGRA